MDKPVVLVTGLSGLVGHRFQQLYQDLYQMVNLDLTTDIDITNPDQVETVFSTYPKAAAVIHLAAFTNVNAAQEQKGDVNGVCYKVNVTGTKTIADAAAKAGILMIHISTDYVFDGTKETPYVETDTPHPIEWYGETKLMAEQSVLSSGVKSLILRLAYPYQAQPMRPDFLAKMVENLNQNTLPPAFTDHTITPTFVDDVAQVFHAAIQEQRQGLYHMVGSSAHTDFEIAQMVKEVFELPGEVKPGSLDAYLATHPRPYQKTMHVSSQKLQQDFGLKMKTLAEGLKEVKRQINE